jgi:hypothetical protein
VHQDNTITTAIKQNGPFTASNGWTVKVDIGPELDIKNKTIYLRGSNRDMDLRIDRTWDLESNYNRDKYIDQVDQAIGELVSWAAMPNYPVITVKPGIIVEYLPVFAYTEGRPTPLKNVAVANKPILRK